MTTIDESRTAKGFTPAALVPVAFGQARSIDSIVIHHWGLTGQTHDGVVNFFCSTGPGETSAHFVVSAGRINCIVSPVDAAWHCPGKNATTIGIECRPEATDADYATVAELVRYLRDQYGPLPLSKHRDWYATACPGVWDIARIDRLAGSAAIAPQGTPSQEDELSAAEVKTITDAVNFAFQRIKDELPGDTAKAVVEFPVPYMDPETGQDTGTTTSLKTATGFADFQANQTRLTAASAPQIAAQINAAGLAESVRDELVKLIGGNK